MCKSLESVANPFVEVMENEYKSLKNYEKSHGKSWILNVNKVYEPCPFFRGCIIFLCATFVIIFSELK